MGISVFVIFNWLCSFFIYALLGRAIMSWFVNPYTSNPNSFAYKLCALLTKITEPLVKPVRNMLSRFNTGRIDLSIFVTMLGIMAIRWMILGLPTSII